MIASGTSGTCNWSIDDNGALTIAPANGTSGYIQREGLITNIYYQWHEYKNSIKRASISGEVRTYTTPFMSQSKEDGSFANMFADCNQLTSVSGLASLKGAKKLSSMFSGCTALQSVNMTGLDTSSVTDFSYMFWKCSGLAALDLSPLNTSAAEDMDNMFAGCKILSSVVFGASFFVPEAERHLTTHFIDASDGISAATNQTQDITVTSDEAFTSLTMAERAGTWQRGVQATFSADAERSTAGTADEDGEDVTISVTYATDATTTARSLTIYQKLHDVSTYPSTPVLTQTLSGDSGTVTVTIQNVGDYAYDFKVEFYDGTNTFMAFPSVQSNIRLFTLDPDGNAELMGDLTVGGTINSKEFTLKKYTVTTTANSSVSPFSAYTQLNISNDVAAYGDPVSIYEAGTSTVVTAHKLSISKSLLFIYSNSAASFDVYVLYKHHT